MPALGDGFSNYPELPPAALINLLLQGSGSSHCTSRLGQAGRTVLHGTHWGSHFPTGEDGQELALRDGHTEHTDGQ